jgi:hypothetical protein
VQETEFVQFPSASEMAAAAESGLTNAVLNVAAVKEFGRATLVQLLESVQGRKALVLDPQLSGPLSYIAERQLLKDHGVEKTAFLLPQRLDTDTKAIIYLVRPDVQLMKHLALQIRAHAKEGQRKEYTVRLSLAFWEQTLVSTIRMTAPPS